MAYTAMYRKFRPDSFEEVKGQEPIVTTLRNQITSGRVGHAYLFCGTRGTGKTSVAKLFAKAINCEHPVNGNPCNSCAVCKAISAGNSMNVLEIDAASNNGVENIREIVEEVRYSPTEGNYRVYIIDEVHMLSIGAFNALLKTLEEPPSYVVFILATTEAHKIPITILSRCQRYDFKRISMDTISLRLQELCKREGIVCDSESMDYIAKLAEGSMRDALSLLERCISFYFEQEITYDKVLEVLGTVDIDVFARMLRHIRGGDVPGCIHVLEEMVVAGRELSRFVIDLTWYIRNLLLAQSGEDLCSVLEVSKEQMQMLIHESKVFEQNQLMRYIQVLSELTNQLRFATQKRVLIEMALIRLCRPQMDADNSGVLDRIRQLEEELSVLKRTGVAAPQPVEPQKEEPEIIELPKALSEDIQAVAKDWSAMVRQFPQPGRLCLMSARPSVTENDRLLLIFDNATDYVFMNTEEKKYELQKLIARVTGKDVTVEMKQLQLEESMKQFVDITVLNQRLKNIVIEEID